MQLRASKQSQEQGWIVSSPKRRVLTGIQELFTSRQVLYALVKRDFKSRYRTSFFGFAWALAKPLAQLVVFALIIGEVLGANRGIEFYAIYLFTGLLVWGFISDSLIIGSNSIVQASGLVTKIQFPREILPLAAVVISFINMLIQIPILILAYIYFSKWPTLSSLTILPIALLTAFFISFGFALLLSAANVFARDTQPLVELLLMLAMYLSPIIYSWTFIVEHFQTISNKLFFNIYFSNPFTIIITNFQDSLWPGIRKFSDGKLAASFFEINPIWVAFPVSIIFVFFAYRVFLKHESSFAREL